MKPSVRTLALVAGAVSATAGVGALASPASALPAIPACNATTSDATLNAKLATYNAAAVTAYKLTAAYQRLHATTVAKKAAYTRTPTSANRSAYLKAMAAETAAVDAQRIYQARSSYTPSPVMQDSALRSWGTYTTRVYVRNKAVLGGYVCTSVDETGLSPSDVADSKSTYQAAVMPSMRIAAITPTVAVPGMRKAAVLSRVKGEVVTNLGGAASPIGVGSGASYSVSGFYNSLQAALTKAKL